MSSANEIKKASNPDDEMLKHLELLMNYEVLESEEDWDTLESDMLDESEASSNNGEDDE